MAAPADEPNAPPPPAPQRRRSARWKTAVLFIVAVLLPLSAVEAAQLYLLAHPSLAARMPPAVLAHLRSIYMSLDRHIVQYMPECAQYDPGLFYTLRPGHCTFQSREFSTELSINSLGVRDDEQSLSAPEIVVVGDSYAMGWGVGQEESFPQQLERRMGMRVLDAGVSSYGTAREMRMLDRVDLSNAKFLVVQYAGNDRDENLRLQREGTLTIGSEQSYRDAVESERKRCRYWFGRYTLALIQNALFPNAQADEDRADAEAFIYALATGSHKSLDGVRLLVLYFCSDEWVRAVEEIRRTRTDLPAFVRDLKLVRMNVPKNGTFLFDEHWTAAGHAAAAKQLARAMRVR